MIRLVTHHCDEHGAQPGEYPDVSVVQCRVERCRKDCAPTGVSVKDHVRRYNDRRRKARQS